MPLRNILIIAFANDPCCFRRVFVIIIVSMMLFTASFESGVAAAVQLPEDSLPSQRVYRFDKEKRDLDEALCACPDLDPCEIGNYQMEGKCFCVARKAFRTANRYYPVFVK